MNTIGTLVASACFVAVAVSIAEALCPEKKFDKQMKIIFAFIFVIAVAAPIASGKIDISLPEMSAYEATLSYSSDAVERQLIDEIESNVGKGLSEELARRNLYVREISVSVNIEDENSISISKVSFIPENESDCESIKNGITQIFGEDVEISGGESLDANS